MYTARASLCPATCSRLLKRVVRGLGATVVLAAALLAAEAGAQTIVLEMQQGAFDDARVKKALIVGASWHRVAEQGGLRPDAIVLRSGRRETEIEPTQPDPKAAQRLLAEAGYGGDRPIQHFIFFEAPLEKMAIAAAGALRGLGLSSQLQAITPQTRDRVIAATRYVTGRQTVELPYLILSQERRAAPPPQRLADLVVTGRPEVDFDPQSRTLTVSTGVANLGSAPAGPHLLVFVERNGALRFPPIEIAGLGPRESRRFETGIRVPEEMLGRKLELQAAIDARNAVREADEGNNRGEVLAFALPAPPRFADLVILDRPEVDFDVQSRELVVSVVVANLGSAEAGPHLLAFADRSGAVRFPPIEIGRLGPRQKQGFKTGAIVPEQSLGRELILRATIDAENAVRESDEDNNRSEALAYRLPAPQRFADLVVAGPPEVDFDRRSRSLTVSIAVANLGDAAAGPHRLVFLDRGGTLSFPPVRIESLGPRQEQSFKSGLRVPEDALGRTLVLFAEIDSEAEVRESNEGNNLSAARRYALPEPAPVVKPVPQPERFADLVVGPLQVDFDPDTRRLTVTVTAGNRGELAAGNHVLIIRDHSGVADLPPLPIASLGPRTQRPFERSVTLPEEALGETLELQAEIDAEGQIDESAEGNNLSPTLRYPLPAPQGLADLTITALHMSSTLTGDAVTVSLSITNRGNARSAATELELHAETAGAWERLRVPALAAGETWRYDWSVPLGSAVFGRDLSVAAFVDPDNTVVEALETNNRRQQGVALPTPPQTWVVGAGLAAAVVVLAIWLLRRKPKIDKPEPTSLRVSYKARRDPGAQEVTRREREPEVLFRLALRPAADPGTQTVSLGARE